MTRRSRYGFDPRYDSGWGDSGGWGSQRGWGQPVGQQDQYDFTPEDEKSLLAEIKSRAIGGLGKLGNLLDVPGSMVRDVVGGENPLDQLLSPMRPENRLTGRDLARKWGLAGQQDNWKNFAGGLAVDIALDPLTWGSLGASALGRLGQATKRAGLIADYGRVAAGGAGKRVARMTKTPADYIAAAPLAERAGAMTRLETAAKGLGMTPEAVQAGMKEPIGGLFGVGVPFMDPLFTVGRGKVAQAIGGRLDVAGQAIRQSTPVRKLAAAWHAPAMGAQSKIVQPMAPDLYRGQARADARAYGLVDDTVGRLRTNLGLDDLAMDQKYIRPLADAKTPADVDRAVSNLSLGAGISPADARTLQQNIRDLLDSMPDDLALHGVELKRLKDIHAAHFPRHMSVEDASRVAGRLGELGKSPQVAARMAEQLGRRPEFKDIVGATDTLRATAIEAAPMIKLGATKSEVAAMIEAKYGSAIPAKFRTHKAQRRVDALTVKRLKKGVSPAQIEAEANKRFPLRNRYPALARIFSKIPQETLEAGIFGNDTIMDLFSAVRGAERAKVHADWTIEVLAQPGALAPAGKAARDIGNVPLGIVFRKLGIDKAGGVQLLAKRQGFVPSQQITEKMHLDALGKTNVAKSVADDLLKAKDRFTSPAVVEEMGGFLQSATNLWKGGVTGPWPGFQARNLGSGQFQNQLMRLGGGRWVSAVKQLATGKSPEQLMQNAWVRNEAARLNIPLTPESAAQLTREVLNRHHVTARHAGLGSEVTGAPDLPGKTFMDYYGGAPGGPRGKMPITFGKAAKKWIGLDEGTTWKPAQRVDDKWQSNIRGVGGATESRFAPMAGGDVAGQLVEDLNRAPPFLHLLNKGVDPAEAARMVANAQVEYAGRAYTPLEQKALLAIPFGKFLKGMTKSMGSELLQRPGGRLGQFIRLQNRLQGEPDEMTPDYLQRGLMIPMKPGPSGADRYLTGFGLMHEDPPQLLSGGLTEMLSRLNPMIKGPLEWATGQSFFQQGPMGGRALEDMDPTMGRLLRNIGGSPIVSGRPRPLREEPVRWPGSRLMEVVAGNLPTTRVATSLRTATDPRKTFTDKALNLLTGARLADVPEHTQEAIVGEHLAAMMKVAGGKTFENVFIPKALLETMTPEQRLAAMRMQALKNMFVKRKRERAKVSR